MATSKTSSISKVMKAQLAQEQVGPFWSSSGEPILSYDLLKAALSVPLGEGASAKTGRLAAALDLWIAEELERAGFGSDGLWPRIDEPHVVDASVLSAARTLPQRLSEERRRMLEKVGTANANVMGSIYVKQVDVGISSWLTGPEVLISTKTMSGSFGKNLANRFEEAYGDVRNLRARYPLALHGFFFLARSTILEEPSAYEKAVHMLSQLTHTQDVYDTVALLVAEWDERGSVRFVNDQARVPEHLSPEHFFDHITKGVLERSSIDSHKEARQLLY